MSTTGRLGALLCVVCVLPLGLWVTEQSQPGTLLVSTAQGKLM